jgi:hypothetical protein
MGEQAQLRAIAADVERREADIERRTSRDNPIPSDVPAPVLEALNEFRDWVAKELNIAPPVMVFFAPRPIDRHIGLYRKDHPEVVLVAAGRPARAIALTIAHECLHAAGLDDEAEVAAKAERLIEQYEQGTPAPLHVAALVGQANAAPPWPKVFVPPQQNWI